MPSCHLVCTGRQPRPCCSSSSCCAGAWTRHTDQSELSTVHPPPITVHLALPQLRVVAVRVLAAGPRRALSGLGAEVGVSTVRVPAAPAHLVRGVADGGGVAAVLVTVAAWTQAEYSHSCLQSRTPTDGVAVAADVPDLHRPQRVVGPGQLQRGHLGPAH